MADSRRRAVTMADVARRANVSPATVSRALSGTRPMDPEVRSRVLEAADALGYRVNLLGRALRKQRSSAVGLVVPDIDNPFFATLAHHLGRDFAQSGTDLLMFSADGSLEAERRGVSSLVGRQVDALIVVPVHEVDSAPALDLATRAVPTVQLDRRVAGGEGHFVGCENAEGMALVARHVSEHVDVTTQPVIFVGAHPTSSSAHERLCAFRTAFGADNEEHLGSFDAAWGQQAADAILASGRRSGTIVTAADVIAIGVLNRIQAAGFRVPDDFRVIGFDGIGVAHLAHPTLTTVRQPYERMARAIRDLVESPGALAALSAPMIFAPVLTLGESSPQARGSI